MDIFFEYVINSTYQHYKQLLRQNFPDYLFFPSANIKFGGFKLNYSWYGITYFDTEELDDLKVYSKTIWLNALYLPPQFGFASFDHRLKDYDFPRLRKTLAHEIAHCVLMDVKPILGILHGPLHEDLTNHIETYLANDYAMQKLEQYRKIG